MSDKPIENTPPVGIPSQGNSKSDCVSLITEITDIHDGSSNNNAIEKGPTNFNTSGTIILDDEKNSSDIVINDNVASNNSDFLCPENLSSSQSEVSNQQNNLLIDQSPDVTTDISSYASIPDTSASFEETNQEKFPLPTTDDKELNASSPKVISTGESEDGEVSIDQNNFPSIQCPVVTTELVSVSGQVKIRETLCSLGLDNKSIEFLMYNWEKFKTKPNILAKKFNVNIQIIEKAVKILSKDKELPDKVKTLSQEEIFKIEEYMKENPETDDYEEIAVMCDIDIEDAERVREYLYNRELSESQKSSISNLFRKGNTIQEISSLVKISSEKVETFLSENKFSFVGKIGEKAFDIINKTLGKVEKVELIAKICSRDLKLQDNLAFRLKIEDYEAYSILDQYFNKFEESKSFMNIKCLTIDDINLIKNSEMKDIEQISVKLQVVESLIEDYMTSYNPYEIELSDMHKQQTNNISLILQEIKPKEILINDYRKIVTDSYNEIIQNLKNLNDSDLFTQLIPVAFYYLKCNLPFKEIASIFSSHEKMLVKMSTQDIFHLIYQQSDPTLRAICIEHYSFSNPIPFYFPVLKDYARCGQTMPQFDICKELWFSVTPFRALISFGLGRAGWNQTGKSSLLNLIFESDFENGNTKGSLFHAGSIDLQMMKNLFSNISDKDNADNIKWAFFDCHGPTDLEVVKLLSKSLKVYIIHILERDYKSIKEKETDLNHFQMKDKHVFLFIRDSKSNVVIETKDNNYTIVLIPNLTSSEVNIELVTKRMKEIGNRILKINMGEEYKLNRQLVENFLGDLKSPRYGELLEDVQKIENILGYIESHGSKEKISFDFLSYYPYFVKLMGLKYRAVVC